MNYSARPYILAETTWKEVKDTNFDVAILPWGATEAGQAFAKGKEEERTLTEIVEAETRPLDREHPARPELLTNALEVIRDREARLIEREGVHRPPITPYGRSAVGQVGGLHLDLEGRALEIDDEFEAFRAGESSQFVRFHGSFSLFWVFA